MQRMLNLGVAKAVDPVVAMAVDKSVAAMADSTLAVESSAMQNKTVKSVAVADFMVADIDIMNSAQGCSTVYNVNNEIKKRTATEKLRNIVMLK